MALSATDTRDRGRPSAWSAALDSLAVDYLGENQTPRLFTVSAGNSGNSLTNMADYPNFNLLQDIHDPGQAWNTLTVGVYTVKTNIVEKDCSIYHWHLMVDYLHTAQPLLPGQIQHQLSQKSCLKGAMLAMMALAVLRYRASVF